MTRTLTEIAVLPIDRRAAVHVEVPADLHDLFVSWIETGTGVVSNDLLGQVPRMAAAFAAHRQAGEYAAREAACAILASAEPKTEAERAIAKIDAWTKSHELDDDQDDALVELDALVREFCRASAGELADLQREIRLHVGSLGMARDDERDALRTELEVAHAAAAQLKLELEAEQGTRKQIEAALVQLREQAQEAMAQVDRLRETAREFTR